MIFKETQEEGFDLISFYNRLNNILYSYINDYVYNEDIDIYYKMILNIIIKVYIFLICFFFLKSDNRKVLFIIRETPFLI